MAAIIPIPTKLNEPRAMNVAAVGRLARDRSSCGKKRSMTTRIAAVWTSP